MVSRRDVNYPKGNVPEPGNYSDGKPNPKKEIPKLNRYLDLNQAVGIGQSTVNRLRNKQAYETAKINRYIDRVINNLNQ